MTHTFHMLQIKFLELTHNNTGTLKNRRVLLEGNSLLENTVLVYFSPKKRAKLENMLGLQSRAR